MREVVCRFLWLFRQARPWNLAVRPDLADDRLPTRSSSRRVSCSQRFHFRPRLAPDLLSGFRLRHVPDDHRRLSQTLQ